MTVSNFVGRSDSSLIGTTSGLAYGSAVTLNSTLIMMIRMGTGSFLNDVSDPTNGAWTIVGPIDNGTARQYAAYFQNSQATGQPTVTITLSTTGISPRWAIAEIVNAAASSFDVSASTTGSGTALTGGSTATTAQTNEAWLAANTTFTQSGSWAILGVEPSAGSSRIAIVYQEPNAVGNASGAVTSSVSQPWVGQTLTFRLAGAGSVTATAALVATAAVASSQAVATSTSISATAATSGSPPINVTLTATAAISTGQNEILQPSLDISNPGGWTTNLGSSINIFSALDELSPDDNDYIRSPSAPNNTQYTMRLGVLFPPRPGARSLRIRHFNDIDGGQVSYTYDLIQNGVILQTIGPFIVTTATPIQVNAVLSANISNWFDPLDLRVTVQQLS
jgi:hypothetical protein